MSRGAPAAPRAAARWREQLEAWAIPDEILAAAPESPWGFPTPLFERAAETARATSTPSRERALEALPPGGSVLDVGAGAGAASLPLVPPAARLVAVDQSADMLAVFAVAADELGVVHREVQGLWPDVADAVDVADVVVCHHVVYNVADLPPFITALTGHARRRVVLELTAAHPLVVLNPLWRHFHRLERPEGPTADDAVAVLAELGITPRRVERPRALPFVDGPLPERVAFVRRRLCLSPDRDAEIADLLPRLGPPPAAVTVWWDR